MLPTQTIPTQRKSRTSPQRPPRGDATKGTGAIHNLPMSPTVPDTTPVPSADIRTGDVLGWLTAQQAGMAPDSSLLCRCDCGVLVQPQTQAVARGAIRSCGDLTKHGRH
jgi:hypothetical protein